MTHKGAFHDVVLDPLPGRSGTPRVRGETMVIDKGLGLSELRDLLAIASQYIDYVKLAFGTAGLYPPSLLKAKLTLIRSHGVGVYPGGTYLEVAYRQGRAQAFMDRARALGFTHIEMRGRYEPNGNNHPVLPAEWKSIGQDYARTTEPGKEEGLLR